LSFYHFFIARVLTFVDDTSPTPQAQVSTLLNNQKHSVNYGDAKEAEILVNETFFVQSNPHSNQKHRNFTDRWG
jgi:hypothetical protein